MLHDSTGGRWLYTDAQIATSPRIYDYAKYYNPGLGEYSAQYGQYYDYDTDDLGSVVGLLGSGETEVEGYADDAFGNSILTFGSNSFTVGQIDLFAAGSGYETDNDTGLIRTGNRYYNPYFGRYMTEDPAEVGDNWYGYCGNDPTGAVDPTGLHEGEPPTPNLAGLDGSDTWAQTMAEQEDAAEYNSGLSFLSGQRIDVYVGPPGLAPDQVTTEAKYWFSFFVSMADSVSPLGPPTGYETAPGGVFKIYKNGARVFVPDEAPPEKPTGHDRGRNVRARGNSEDSRNPKGNRNPPSIGGGGVSRVDVADATLGAGTVVIGWEVAKWVVAVVGAPETGGSSLLLLAAP